MLENSRQTAPRRKPVHTLEDVTGEKNKVCPTRIVRAPRIAQSIPDSQCITETPSHHCHPLDLKKPENCKKRHRMLLIFKPLPAQPHCAGRILTIEEIFY